MAKSSRAENFFQPEDYLRLKDRKQEKSNNQFGDPIQLPSKILAITADPNRNDSVFVAESAGTVRRLSIEEHLTIGLYRGPTAPLTSVAVSADGNTLFAGCWDKCIWSWNVQTLKVGHRFEGHSDFIKSVLWTLLSPMEGGSSTSVLISAGADAKIIVWNAKSGEQLHVLRGHRRGVLDLAILPSALGAKESVTSFGGPVCSIPPTTIQLFSSGSTPEIKQWFINLESATELAPVDGYSTIQAHKTSINKLVFQAIVHSNGTIGCNLWTASSDKTSLCLERAKSWAVVTVLPHPDFVKDILVQNERDRVITACRDENIRIWDIEDGNLLCTIIGHFEEVTALAIVYSEGQEFLVSGSIDGTVRSWNIDDAEIIRKKAALENDEVEERWTDDVKTESIMTAEEEQELEDLINDTIH